MSALRAAVNPAKNLRISRATKRRPKYLKTAGILILGIGLVELGHLSMVALTTAGAYEISNLKTERAELDTQLDIIGSQVSSLSSNQNLVNVAHALGMVSNVNPVFLRLSDNSVIGKPRRAQANERTVSKNLVPNASMTTDTNTTELDGLTAHTVLGSSESSSSPRSGSIQASPTY